MYAEEYKAWIAREAMHPSIIETFDTFKTPWVDKIDLIKQTAIPVRLHSYGMATLTRMKVDVQLWHFISGDARIS